MASNTTVVDYPGVLPPPPGVTPNIINPETIGWKLILASVLCPFFALLFWGLRFYTTRCITRRIYMDDYYIMISLVFAIGLSVVDIAVTQNGMGTHMWDLTMEKFKVAIVLGVPSSIFYNLSTLFVKASILSFYLRFAAANRPFRIAVYIVMFIVVGYSLNAGFSFLYLCNPIRSLWDSDVKGTCVDLYTPYLVSAVVNAVTDVVILVLPIWLLWPLRVPLKRKLAVGLVLMPGGFVCGVSFFRLAVIPEGVADSDTTWRYCINNIWCLVELYVGIICACLPSLKNFAKHHFPHLFSNTTPGGTHARVGFSIFTVLPIRMRTRTRRSRAPVDDDLDTDVTVKTDVSGEGSHAGQSEAGVAHAEAGGRENRKDKGQGSVTVTIRSDQESMV